MKEASITECSNSVKTIPSHHQNWCFLHQAAGLRQTNPSVPVSPISINKRGPPPGTFAPWSWPQSHSWPANNKAQGMSAAVTSPNVNTRKTVLSTMRITHFFDNFSERKSRNCKQKGLLMYQSHRMFNLNKKEKEILELYVLIWSYTDFIYCC